MALAVIVEADALFAARDVPCIEAVVFRVAQATLFVLLANGVARVLPVVTEVLAIMD